MFGFKGRHYGSTFTWRVDAEHGDEEVVVARVDGMGKGKSLVDFNGFASGANWVQDEEKCVSKTNEEQVSYEGQVDFEPASESIGSDCVFLNGGIFAPLFLLSNCDDKNRPR